MRRHMLFEHGIQESAIVFSCDERQQGLDRRAHVTAQSQVEFRPSPQAFWAKIDLRNRGADGHEIVVRKIRPQKKQRVALVHCLIGRSPPQKAALSHRERVIEPIEKIGVPRQIGARGRTRGTTAAIDAFRAISEAGICEAMASTGAMLRWASNKP